MTIKKKLLLSILTVGVIGVAATGATHAMAQTSDTNSPIVAELAQKIGLDQSKVKQAFDSIHADRQAQHIANVTKRLDQAMKDGKLTESQKQLILSKMKELQTERKNMRDRNHEELRTWAKQNNIDIQYLFGEFKMFGKMRRMW